VTTKSLMAGVLEFRRLDELAARDSCVHRLDARAKVLVTVAFLLAVMSHGRHEVASLAVFFLYPAAVLALGRLPVGFVLRKAAYVLPFALLVALPNPWFDREVMAHWGSLEVSGGWLSALSIVLRALLATAAALLLVAVTGFPVLCQALARLGLPDALVLQLLLLYRYLAVLAQEALHLSLARELRGNGRVLTLGQAGPLLGTLLLRTWARAERIHVAMLARGFTGTMGAAQARRPGVADAAWLLGWVALFLLWRHPGLAASFGASLRALATAAGPP
jgi:cobalt/nickel transport system permease protein